MPQLHGPGSWGCGGGGINWDDEDEEEEEDDCGADDGPAADDEGPREAWILQHMFLMQH